MENNKIWNFASEEEIEIYNNVRNNQFLKDLQTKRIKHFVYYLQKHVDFTKIDEKIISDYILGSEYQFPIDNKLALLIIDDENLKRFKTNN